MKWFRSRYLEALVEIHQRATIEVEQRLAESQKREDYWRARYERLADAMLFRNGDIAAPLHVEPKPLENKSVGAAIARVANLAGNMTGIPFERVPRG